MCFNNLFKKIKSLSVMIQRHNDIVFGFFGMLDQNTSIKSCPLTGPVDTVSTSELLAEHLYSGGFDSLYP